MENLDIIILGATGFTGKHLVKNLAKTFQDNANFTFGVSGRSREKLQKLLTELREAKLNNTNIPVIECDITKDDIKIVTRQARILLNCTGPNTLLSAHIVEACIETRTHYVDISAELYHMIKLYTTYHKRAEEANVLIVPACGFSAIPAVSGLMYLEKNFEGILNAVECYNEVMIPKRAYMPGPNRCLVHYGTWESLVHVLNDMRACRRLMLETYPEPIYEQVPHEIKRSFFHRNRGKLWFPYPGPDEDIVDMSQRYLHEKKGKTPYHYKMYTTMPLWIHFLIIPAMFLYYYLCYFKCFRRLLWKYPKTFTLGYMSHKGPTTEMANDTKFALNFYGTGFDKNSSEKSLAVRVKGYDPGYRTTSLTLMVAALTIITESKNIPQGGVLSVGAAFRDTKLVENLIKHSVLEFEVLEQ